MESNQMFPGTLKLAKHISAKSKACNHLKESIPLEPLVFDFNYMDVCGKLIVTLFGESLYFVSYIADCSSYIGIYGITSEAYVLSTLKIVMHAGIAIGHNLKASCLDIAVNTYLQM